MDFNNGETVVQKTQELIEKILLEHWYNSGVSIAHQIKEQNSGRQKETAEVRSSLTKFCLCVSMKNKRELLAKIIMKESSFDNLIDVFWELSDHLENEGITKYGRVKSIIGRI